MDDAQGLAASALAKATVEPDAAQSLARRSLNLARRSKSAAACSVASRALGLAALQLRDLTLAARALQAAVSYGQHAHDRQLVGEARMSLAAVLCVRGRASQAVRQIELALCDLSGVALARGLTQRAAVLQDLGRFDDALTDLRRALPMLRQAGDAQWEARARSNRGNLLITRRAFRAAENDLDIARRLCIDNDLKLQGAYVEHNLGWLHSSRRDVVAALEHFDLAERKFSALGMRVGSLLTDRAELLLSVRLMAEAREAAEGAVDVHRRELRTLQVPEAQLLLSTVALVQGDTAVAMKNADRALRGYRRLGRADGIALARYAKLQAVIARDPRSVAPLRARKSAEQLAEAGWAVPALEARILAGTLSLSRGHPRDAHSDLAAAARARFAGPAEVRARAWLAEAQLRAAEGRRRSAKLAVSSGLRIIDDYQATLGATELRAHVSVHRGSLAALGLQMALEDRHPAQVLSFVERGRASALVPRGVRPPDDPNLSEVLADLRTTVSEIEERRQAGRSTSELTKRQVWLERSIADYIRRTPAVASEQFKAQSVAELSSALGDEVLVEFIEQGDSLHAVTLAGGHAKLHDLGDARPVREQTAHLLFGLRRLGRPRVAQSGQQAANAMINSVRRSLDATLLAPLADEVADRPLVLVPAGSLQSMPWSVLPSCVGRPVSISPSAMLWHRARRKALKHSGRILVVAGPLLPGALQEALAVADLYPEAQLLTGEAASATAVAAAMDGSVLAHIAAHGNLRSDNPLFSSLQMADGPLTVYDLERLETPPAHVVLAACDAARGHMVTADELLGLAAALLGQGTRSLVAPVMPVLDAPSVPLMRSYHNKLRAVGSPAVALAAAQAEAAVSGGVAWATAAPFVCLGDGHSPVGLPACVSSVSGLGSGSVATLQRADR